MVKLKICGLFRSEDIVSVNEARPDYCGFVINYPQSHRSLTPRQVRELRAGLSDHILPVGVFVDQPVPFIAELVLDKTLSGVQLHGQEDEEYILQLRKIIGKTLIIQAFTVRIREDIETALRSTADYILLDRGRGSGQTFDWHRLTGIDRPFFLAGGLGPHNLQQALNQVRPWGVDLSSGVEENKIKKREKIQAVADLVKRSC